MRDRHPRYGRFLVTGALLGLGASVVLLLGFRAGDSGRDGTELTILLTAFLAGSGALLGGLLAVLLDRRASVARRARHESDQASSST